MKKEVEYAYGDSSLTVYPDLPMEGSVEMQKSGSSMEIKSLSLNYGKIRVLDSIDCIIPEGCITALLGANGSGKTSLLRCLYGELNPVQGEFFYDGCKINTQAPEWKHLSAAVPDDDALFPDLSIAEQLSLAATVFGIAETEGKRRAKLLLDLFNLAGKQHTLCSELSAGMRKRAALSMALMHGPQLLFMDEPLNALDYESGEVFFRVLNYLKSKRRTVLLSGHHHTALLSIADYVIELRQGRVFRCLDLREHTGARDKILNDMKKTGFKDAASTTVSKEAFGSQVDLAELFWFDS